MAEYIERNKLLHKIRWASDPEDCVMIAKRMPASDVARVRHGRWVPTEAPFMNECEDCSVCGYRTVWGHGYNYCPNCGARMDGG